MASNSLFFAFHGAHPGYRVLYNTVHRCLSRFIVSSDRLRRQTLPARGSVVSAVQHGRALYSGITLRYASCEAERLLRGLRRCGRFFVLPDDRAFGFYIRLRRPRRLYGRIAPYRA